MAFPRKRRAAFTLTEMLMAAGILGIGLTMVASIFPVAVDQSRRSRDQTMAALCARSAVAMLRADRAKVIEFMRSKGTYPQNPPAVFQTEPASQWYTPDKMYAPGTFLYRTDPTRSYKGLRRWNAGNFVARIWATRVGTGKPIRFTIVVCRSTGAAPPKPYQAAWSRYRPNPKPGQYVIERKSKFGMAYMLDHVTPAKEGYLVIGTTASGVTEIPPDSSWTVVPNAVAAYHLFVAE